MKKKLTELEKNKMINKMASVIDYLRSFEALHEQSFKELLIQYDYKHIYEKNLLLSEFHIIDCIGKHSLPNATFIAKELNMTKGAISKLTAKLMEKNLIKGNRLENNKKEIYYSLTPIGKEAFEVHRKLHEIEEERLVKIFSKYDKQELDVIYRFLDDIIKEL